MGKGSDDLTQNAAAGDAVDSATVHHSKSAPGQPGWDGSLGPDAGADGLQSGGQLVFDFIRCAGDLTAEEERAQWLAWCNYNRDAAEFLEALFRMSQRVDDVVDGECQDVLSAMVMLVNDSTICMANNRFFSQHASILTPVMLCSLLNWYVSTRWQNSKEKSRQLFAFVLRESLEQVIFLVAFLCGGIQHAMGVAENVLEFYHVKRQDDFEQWRAEHA